MLTTYPRPATFLLLTAALLMAADKKSDRDSFQGNWKLTSAETGNGKEPADEVESATLLIKDDKMTFSMTVNNERKSQELIFKLDEAKSPRQIDITEGQAGDVGAVHLGIYKLEGDTLTICKSHPPADRPADFTTKPGEKWPMIIVLKRQKSE